MDNIIAEDVKAEPATEPQKEIEIKPTALKVKEKRSSKDEKSRKKDERSVEQILKSLSDLDPERKLNAMVKKYMEILDENRRLQALLKQSEKKIIMVQKEKDQCESEKCKAVLTRSRLESLCRELQRQNKAIKEESLLKIKEEEEKRKEVSAKFQTTLTEITALMTETNDKNVKLHEDNMEIHRKFKTVFEEMDVREKHYEEMHQLMKQELQSAETKLAKVTLEMTEEREKMLTEKSAMLHKLTEYQVRIRDLQAIEAGLRSQVTMYTDKYEEFQNALTKSNEVFGGFNQEMGKMSKKILKLEKESLMWKSRWEKNNLALLEMATDKQTRDAEFITLNKKCTLLQELCKTFQQERATLIAQLKEKSKAEDNQVIENGNITDNLSVNKETVANDANNTTGELAKDLKTELTCSVSEKTINKSSESLQESNESNSNLELIVHKKDEENIPKIVNSNTENELQDNITKVNEVQQSPVVNINCEAVEKNSTESSDEKKISQVPVDIKSNEVEVPLNSELTNVSESDKQKDSKQKK